MTTKSDCAKKTSAMTNGSKRASHRKPQPLQPQVGILLVDGDRLVELKPTEVTVSSVGYKAFGLSCIPQCWIKSLFVVKANKLPSKLCLDEAAKRMGFNVQNEVYVRSSGVVEDTENRGSYDSRICSLSDCIKTIQQLTRISSVENSSDSLVHWLIQERIADVEKGHVSNERYLCHDYRDWVVEYGTSELHPLSLRRWRDASISTPNVLVCNFRENITVRLTDVAKWGYEKYLRLHFEWVWDGKAIYIVQAQECPSSKVGVNPKNLVILPDGDKIPQELNVFRFAEPNDFDIYRKLSNSKLYKDLGYKPVPFFVLDDELEMQKIIKEGVFSEKIKMDLAALTGWPLIIRTDCKDQTLSNVQMLPRSDELRSADSAIKWLQQNFSYATMQDDLRDKNLCLIAHHFIPATSSAWCKASPNERRVRIESLWGNPEGIYWYPHDVYDVDTLHVNVQGINKPPKEIKPQPRIRYKRRFIAPDEHGKWIVHQTNETSDWKASIEKKHWIQEIAWVSRRIATALDKSVVVMWFIDISEKISPHQVYPWYHEDWKQDGPNPRAAPRKRKTSGSEYSIKTRLDWDNLVKDCNSGKTYARVVVEPTEPDLVRDRKFAKPLGELANKHSFIIQMAGGLLSHAYHMLQQTGCSVECSDLYATDSEEIEFNKLVRDKIPNQIQDRGEIVEVIRLGGEALVESLKRKVVEEAFEILDSKSTEQLIDEIADLREVISALMALLDINDDAVAQSMKNKKTNRGGFLGGLMLQKTKLEAPISSKQALDDGERKNLKVVTKSRDLPSHLTDIHVDRRIALSGAKERQFTLQLPAHAFGFSPLRQHFDLDTPSEHPHNMMLEIQLERVGSELKCKLRLLNDATQESLPLEITKE